MKKYPVAERKIANIALSIFWRRFLRRPQDNAFVEKQENYFYLGAWMLVSWIVGDESWVIGCGGSEEKDEPGVNRYLE